MQAHHIDGSTGEDEFSAVQSLMATAPDERDPNQPSTWGYVGRNEPCPCGSGKKYKHCHGALNA